MRAGWRKAERMSQVSEATDRLCDRGIVAIVRASSSGQLIDVARALLAGGVDCIEITMTTPDALEVIRQCRKAVAGAMIGVGSVLDAAAAAAAIGAGAQFVVSPVFVPGVLAKAHELGVPVVPGCFTPTEILSATNAGADLVKVFPAGLFGPEFIKAVLAPMPHLKLTPTGGVDLATAAAWIAAGAKTLGVGAALVTRKALAEGDFAQIESLARQYVRIVADARAAPARHK
jgi:2-dehydro-3-deoxyphosphogluconate aldolase/(4S)-4-hydroxy-2-oxoglutarate aldolase